MYYPIMGSVPRFPQEDSSGKLVTEVHFDLRAGSDYIVLVNIYKKYNAIWVIYGKENNLMLVNTQCLIPRAASGVQLLRFAIGAGLRPECLRVRLEGDEWRLRVAHAGADQ